MVEVTLNGKTYRRIEGSEISAARHNYLTQEAIAVWHDLDNATWHNTFKRWLGLKNEGKPAEADKVIWDHAAAVATRAESDVNPWQVLFAVLHLEKGEDEYPVDEGLQKKKAKEMESVPLQQMKDTVTDFMTAFPENYLPYLEALEVLKMNIEAIS